MPVPHPAESLPSRSDRLHTPRNINQTLFRGWLRSPTLLGHQGQQPGKVQEGNMQNHQRYRYKADRTCLVHTQWNCFLFSTKLLPSLFFLIMIVLISSKPNSN
eukprot:EG_transcript_35503